MNTEVLEDCWAEEANKRLQVLKLENGSIRFQITNQIGNVETVVTIASFRAKRIADAIYLNVLQAK